MHGMHGTTAATEAEAAMVWRKTMAMVENLIMVVCCFCHKRYWKIFDHSNWELHRWEGSAVTFLSTYLPFSRDNGWHGSWKEKEKGKRETTHSSLLSTLNSQISKRNINKVGWNSANVIIIQSNYLNFFSITLSVFFFWFFFMHHLRWIIWALQSNDTASGIIIRSVLYKLYAGHIIVVIFS